jgi:hypothetical protein
VELYPEKRAYAKHIRLWIRGNATLGIWPVKEKPAHLNQEMGGLFEPFRL